MFQDPRQIAHALVQLFTDQSTRTQSRSTGQSSYSSEKLQATVQVSQAGNRQFRQNVEITGSLGDESTGPGLSQPD
eukprot:6875537-Pyramimonas_sp.AAC.2